MVRRFLVFHVNFEKLWEDIQPSLVSLVSGVPQSLTNERWLEMYNGIYKICTNPHVPQAELLFFRLRSVLVLHVERILDDLRRIPGQVEFLQAYCSQFRSFTTGTSYISELFRYLNRYWISYSHCESGQAPVPGVYPVTELALHIWHDIAFIKLRKKIVSSVMHIFQIVRNNRSEVFDDGELIANLVETYFTLGMIRKDPMAFYREDLEAPFLEKYYAKFLAKRLIKANCFDKRYEFALSFYQLLILMLVLPSSPVESPKVAKATVREVEEDRKMALQAAIVRVMKTRRDILQQQLQVEVAEMLHNQFVPSATAMKQNIDILIQKEYMRRHDSDELRLLYVA
ncbi:hypothetical protein ATCC90586_001053 [Pythium insidiosum]|nr:hypothetical protein ATCC90586_001053 [Pythium insidiosum]